jgi:hypothetical protein
MVAQRFCAICKQLINPERAEAIPETILCTQHAHEIAQFGGEFVTRVSHDKTSKPGSLKKNFGGVTTKKFHNDIAIRKLRAKYEDQRS